MRIEVAARGESITQTGKNNKKYNVFELTYYSNGKKLNRKIFSFNKEVYDVLKGSNEGDMFEVSVEKNGEYTDWKSAATFVPAPADVEVAAKEKKVADAKVSGNNSKAWETPEERAARQEMIVRQSSISNAIEFFGNQAPIASFDVAAVLEVAKQFRDFVYQTPALATAEDLTTRVE